MTSRARIRLTKQIAGNIAAWNEKLAAARAARLRRRGKSLVVKTPIPAEPEVDLGPIYVDREASDPRIRNWLVQRARDGSSDSARSLLAEITRLLYAKKRVPAVYATYLAEALENLLSGVSGARAFGIAAKRGARKDEATGLKYTAIAAANELLQRYGRTSKQARDDLEACFGRKTFRNAMQTLSPDRFEDPDIVWDDDRLWGVLTPEVEHQVRNIGGGSKWLKFVATQIQRTKGTKHAA